MKTILVLLCILFFLLIHKDLIYSKATETTYSFLNYKNENGYELIEESSAISKVMDMPEINTNEKDSVRINIQTHDQGTRYVYFVTKNRENKEMVRRFSEKGKYFESAFFEFDTASDKKYIESFCGIVAEYKWQEYVRYYYSAKLDSDDNRCRLFESTPDDNAMMEEISGSDIYNKYSFDKDITQYSRALNEKNIILIGRSTDNPEKYGMFAFSRVKMNTDITPIRLNDKQKIQEYDMIKVPLNMKGGIPSQLPSPKFDVEYPNEQQTSSLRVITNINENTLSVSTIEIGEEISLKEEEISIKEVEIPEEATLNNYALYYVPGKIIVANMETNDFYTLHDCNKDFGITTIGPILPSKVGPVQYLIMNNKHLYKCSAKKCSALSEDLQINEIFTNDEALKSSIDLMLEMDGKLMTIQTDQDKLNTINTDINSVQVLSTYGTHFIAKSCDNKCDLYDIEALTNKKEKLATNLNGILMAINDETHLYFMTLNDEKEASLLHINLATEDNCLPSCGKGRAVCNQGKCEPLRDIKNALPPYYQKCKENYYGPTCDTQCTAKETCYGFGRCSKEGTCECFIPGKDQPPYYNSSKNCNPKEGCAANVFNEPFCNVTCSSATCHPSGGQCIKGQCKCFNDASKGFWTGPQCRSCQSGYQLSHQCKSFSCFGKLGRMGCSDHGECSALNTCVCDHGFVGKDCNLPTCYGIISSSEYACSGNGKCTDVNKCECSAGYEGINCRNWKQAPNDAFNVLILILAAIVVVSYLVVFGFITIFYANKSQFQSSFIQLVEDGHEYSDGDSENDFDMLASTTHLTDSDEY
mmetsp:Transcript_261/g.480  ORF Transcript_261/g.480 Transcript_261/m.480 type:complete len:813 (+) Transcript_261:42-2480(+)